MQTRCFTGRLLAAAAVAAAALAVLSSRIALAQDASRDAGGGDYRLRVVEPTEGLGVTASTMRVTVELDARPRVGDGSPGARATPTPAPQVEIFVDGASQGVLPADRKTMLVERLGAGPHTLFVTATDANGVVVDRKEVHFTVLPPPPG
jgi:hypothetical protein